jgi:hypothetical protein
MPIARRRSQEISMKRERTPQPQESRTRELRASSPNAEDESRAVANDVRDELDGQLGPDELPDPSEVVMNREAKLHRG